MIDTDPRVLLQPHIPVGDTLLWAGRPDPSVRFTKADRVVIPGTVFMACFMAFWTYQVLQSDAPWFFLAVGAILLVAVLWLAVGRFVHKARRARNTVYGLTADTAYIVTGGTTTEIPLRYAPLTVTGASDGQHLTVLLEARQESNSFWKNNNRGLFGVRADNTGAEMIGGGSFTNAFYDVADVAGLRRALDTVNAELDRR